MAFDDEGNLSTQCIRPTLEDAFFKFLLPILIINISTRLLTLLVDYIFIKKLEHKFNLLEWKLSKFFLLNANNFIIIIFGFVLLSYHFHEDSFDQKLFTNLIVIIASIGITILVLISRLTESYSNILIWILWLGSFIIVAANELFIWMNYDQGTFVKLRPNIMLFVMKSISYFYETKSGTPLTKKTDGDDYRKTSKTFFEELFQIYFEFLAYLVHPNSLILGVWHPHVSRKTNKSIWLQSVPNGFARSLLSFSLSLIFLVISSCLIEVYFISIINYLFDILETTIPLSWIYPIEIVFYAYSTALQFHFSHYFICFAAQSMFDLWDIRQALFIILTITKPIAIEIPRSLVNVVVAWNIPMHQWLKCYVFQPFKHYCGGNIYATIFFTYFISSYLHGFNFQIWTVLLTLGLLTQAEFKLRSKLANIFSSCIESRTCQYYLYQENDNDDSIIVKQHRKCTKSNHIHTGQHWFSLVRLTNFMFTILALVNLAFLGSTFDGKLDSSTIDNVWLIWRDLYFYSHITHGHFHSVNYGSIGLNNWISWTKITKCIDMRQN
ncbi:hypothetical protein BLOT_008580 [Blomia tropicalis]|nr:hypothetical protein BLOT_008580 [Blomia tropicalis]